jgi:hypothetical protein
MQKAMCETIRIAAMAIADGHQAEMTEMTSHRIEEHLADCATCRLEIDQLRALDALMNIQQRQPQSERLWSRIEMSLPETSMAKNESSTSHLFILLGLFLIGYKLFEMIPDRDLGFLFKLIPIFFVVAAFAYLKVNPFKIDTELALEGGDEFDD